VINFDTGRVINYKWPKTVKYFEKNVNFRELFSSNSCLNLFAYTPW